MTDLTVREIAIFAERYNVSPDAAVALPSIFEKVAGIGGFSVRAAIALATYDNPGLADYIVEVANSVTH